MLLQWTNLWGRGIYMDTVYRIVLVLVTITGPDTCEKVGAPGQPFIGPSLLNTPYVVLRDHRPKAKTEAVAMCNEL